MVEGRILLSGLTCVQAYPSACKPFWWSGSLYLQWGSQDVLQSWQIQIRGP